MADETKPDDSEPTPERQGELRAAYEANVAAGKAPYEGVRIRTRGELQWVMRERDWSGDPEAGGKGRADLRGALLMEANLSEVHLFAANLSGADLWHANLSGADLGFANLSKAHLSRVNFSETLLVEANLSGANLRFARMNAGTNLGGATLDSSTRLGDVVWNGIPLTRLDWERVRELGDEQVARETEFRPNGVLNREGKKDKPARLQEYITALLANRQVAAVLRAQGLNEHADRFGFRAQKLQRIVFRRQAFLVYKRWKPGPQQRLRWLAAYIGSWVLDLLAGYGYRVWRILAVYGLTVAAFAGVYFALGLPNQEHLSTAQTVANAFQVSLTAIHGRWFFEQLGLGSALAWAAAVESVFGIVIEGIFIAVLIQRFFAR